MFCVGVISPTNWDTYNSIVRSQNVVCHSFWVYLHIIGRQLTRIYNIMAYNSDLYTYNFFEFSTLSRFTINSVIIPSNGKSSYCLPYIISFLVQLPYRSISRDASQRVALYGFLTDDNNAMLQCSAKVNIEFFVGFVRYQWSKQCVVCTRFVIQNNWDDQRDEYPRLFNTIVRFHYLHRDSSHIEECCSALITVQHFFMRAGALNALKKSWTGRTIGSSYVSERYSSLYLLSLCNLYMHIH